LIQHYTGETDGITYYEANESNAYMLIRSGRIIQLVEERYGEASGAIMSNLLLLGHTTIMDLNQAYGFHKNKKENGIINSQHINGDRLVNGPVKDLPSTVPNRHFKSISDFHAALRRLLSTGFITAVSQRHFRPTADIQEEAIKQVIRDNVRFKDGTKGPKKSLEFQTEVKALLKKWRDERVRPVVTQDWGRKRPQDHDSYGYPPHKRQKVNGLLHNQATDSDSESDNENEDIALLDVSSLLGFSGSSLITNAKRFFGVYSLLISSWLA
jgi:DNA-directed RNA polymerase III subunit RPC3